MKRLRKISGFLLAFFMLFVMGLITPVHAAPNVPETTKVTIHKVVGTGGFQLNDHDGRLLTTTEIAALGTNAVENNAGVEFTAWLVPAGTLVTAFNDFTDAQVTASDLTGNPVVVKAGEEHSFATGTYYVRETMHPATLKTQLGVPFILELPVLNTNNSDYLAEVHLYPKNVIENDKPEIDKDVKVKGQDHAGFDVGNTFSYLIYPKVPAGIESYTLFKVSDDLESALDYMGNVVVTYNGTTLVKDADYTLAEDSLGTSGGNFTLTFTKTGLEKLALHRPQSETLKDLEIKFQARINNTASMGTDIYNNAVLTYNNGYTTDQIAEVAPVNEPKVHTGGRQFIKVDNVTQTYLSGLGSASFVVKNAEGKYMVKDEAGKISWVAAIDDATKIYINGDDGTFEVTGLAYGDDNTALNYSLVEVNVPNGYVKMNDLTFTIDASSYGDKINIADNTKVINVKKPLIPQTGGIGSIIFLTAGILMMGTAIIALRRKKQVNK